MQDFRNFNENGITRLPRESALSPVPNEYGGIYDKPKTPKIGFIEARMNKDNFWNLVFGIAFPFGFIVAVLTAKLSPSISVIVVCSLIIGIPFVVRKNSKVSFTQDRKFLNSEGRDITNSIPSNILWPILVAVGVTALFNNLLDICGNSISLLLEAILSLFFVAFLFFFSFASYFILINCPISVLFNLDVWKQKSDFSTSHQPHHKSPFDSSHDDRYSLSRSYLPSNIHHRSR